MNPKITQDSNPIELLEICLWQWKEAEKRVLAYKGRRRLSAIWRESKAGAARDWWNNCASVSSYAGITLGLFPSKRFACEKDCPEYQALKDALSDQCVKSSLSTLVAILEAKLKEARDAH